VQDRTVKYYTATRTTSARGKNKTKPRGREPRTTFSIRDTMRFLQGNNINRDWKRSQPPQETFTLRKFTKAINIKIDYGQGHN